MNKYLSKHVDKIKSSNATECVKMPVKIAKSKQLTESEVMRFVIVKLKSIYSIDW